MLDTVPPGSTSSWGERRQEMYVLAAAGAIVLTFMFSWAVQSVRQRSIGDFAPAYAAATMVREGNVRQIYEPRALGRVGDRLVAPARLVVPYQAVAWGAVLAVPFTTLSLPIAFVAWGLFQLALLVAAAVIAARAAGTTRSLSSRGGLAIAAIAMAGLGTPSLLGGGQWSGFNALGVAMAYRCWRRGSYAAGGAWLAGTAAIAKPHLALGLIVFTVAMGKRRATYGALAAGGSALAGFAALMGVEGFRSFIRSASLDVTLWNPRGGSSFFALPSMWFDNGPPARVVGLAGALIALSLCAALGRCVSRDSALLGPGMAAATALSLLASPHAFVYDTVMLAPAVAWSLSELDLFGSRRAPLASSSPWIIVALWATATWVDGLLDARLRPLLYIVGEFGVWTTIALSAALWAVPALRRRQRGTLAAPMVTPFRA